MRIVPYEPRHADAWRDPNIAWISRDFAPEPRDIEVLDDEARRLDARGL